MDTLRTRRRRSRRRLFTPDHLRAQQQQIARRIEHVGRPARVLNFPGASVRRHHPTPRRRARRRAGLPRRAAAGLFVGVARRHVLRHQQTPRPPVRRCRGGRAASSRSRRAAVRSLPSSTATTCSCRISRSRAIGRAPASCGLRCAHARTSARSVASTRADADVRELDLDQAEPSVAFPHLPQRPRPQACRRRHAGRELSQRDRRADQGRRLHASRRPPDRASRARVRLLLRRRSRGRLRLSDARALSRSAASSSPAKSSTTRTSTTSCARWASASSPTTGEHVDALGRGRRGHPAGVRRHRRDAASSSIAAAAR